MGPTMVPGATASTGVHLIGYGVIAPSQCGPVNGLERRRRPQSENTDPDDPLPPPRLRCGQDFAGEVEMHAESRRQSAIARQQQPQAGSRTILYRRVAEKRARSIKYFSRLQTRAQTRRATPLHEIRGATLAH